MKQAIQHQNNHGWRWLIIFGSLLLLAMVSAQVIMILSMPIATFQGDLADHIVVTAISCIFYLVGIIILLRINTLPAASIAYGVFLCASLIFCLFNISSYRESVIAMSLLSVLAHGLAATFVCQLVFPAGWSIRRLHISPYTPLMLSLVLCSISLPALILFPSLWIVATLLVYVFPCICIVIVTWGILTSLQPVTENNRLLDGMPLLGIALVLPALSIIDGKSTLYQIIYLPSTVGFLVFYTFFVACIVLGTGSMFWAWRHLALRRQRIIALIIFSGTFLLLILGIAHFFDHALVFLQSSLEKLFPDHLLSVPLLILPLICYYAFIYHQLSSNEGLLSRHFIRGTLWFILASCFVASQIIASVLAIDFGNDNAEITPGSNHAEITLVCISWLFLSCWLFPLLWGKVRDIGDRMFYRDFYHYNRTLRDLSLALTRLRDLHQICAFTLPRLTTLLNASGAALLVWQDAEEPSQHWQSYQYEAVPHSMQVERFKEAVQYATALNHGPQLINGILVLPLYDGNNLRGCLCLGEKLNHEPYSRQDKSFLETLAAQLAVLEASTRYLDQVHMHTQQVTALNHRILQAQEDERRRLALELHDDVLQHAMLLTRQLTDLADGPSVAPALSLAHSITNSLRSTCLELRPPLLDELGLPEALRWLAQQMEQQNGTRVIFQECTTTDRPFQRPASDVELTLYRVGQEALTNVVKHAEASLVRVRLRSNVQGAIALLIVDNGHGLQRSRPLTGSLGLTGMAERMQAIGGKWTLRSSPGRGVAIRALHHPPGIETGNAAAKSEVELHEHTC
ncbi:MAG: GAF domain-containing protein [Ktedonobacteraceae bacterium]|nr:GAF domain-containing protein [Ktedonobacteraceae bacterium]